jgi:hypothetical protein
VARLVEAATGHLATSSNKEFGFKEAQLEKK